jgi:hypothetical protein
MSGQVDEHEKSGVDSITGVVDISGLTVEELDSFTQSSDDVNSAVRIQRRGSETILVAE